MAETELEPLAPKEALDWYLEHRRDDLRTATRRKHRSALSTFVGWTEEATIVNMNDIGVVSSWSSRPGARPRQTS